MLAIPKLINRERNNLFFIIYSLFVKPFWADIPTAKA